MLKITLNNSTISNLNLKNTKTNKLISINSVINNISILDSDIILAGIFNTSINAENTSIIHLDESVYLNSSYFTLTNGSNFSKNISINGKLLADEILTIDINPNIFLRMNINSQTNSQIYLTCLSNDNLEATNIENLSSAKINILPRTNSNIILNGTFNTIDFSNANNITLSLPPTTSVFNYQNITNTTFKSISGSDDNLKYLEASTVENLQPFIKSMIYSLNVINNTAFLNIPTNLNAEIASANILLNGTSYPISIL